MDPKTRYNRLVEESPSAKLVYKVLELDAPLTHSEIEDNTLLPNRTVSYALSRLQDANLIETTPCPSDPRKKNYCPRPIELSETPPAERDMVEGPTSTATTEQPSD